MRRLLILILVMMFPTVAGAQEATPVVPSEPRPFVDGLPRGSIIGAGWFLYTVTDPRDSPELAYKTQTAYYTGPDGSRIRLIMISYEETLSSAMDALAYATLAMEDVQYTLLPRRSSGGHMDLVNTPAIAGCGIMERVEGLEPVTLYPVGVSVCVHDASRTILVTVVSGWVRTSSGTHEYHDASDYVTEVLVEDYAESAHVRG